MDWVASILCRCVGGCQPRRGTSCLAPCARARNNPVVQIRGASWEDAEQVVDLIGATLGVAGIRLEHLRSEWERPDFRLGEDNLVAERGRQR